MLSLAFIAFSERGIYLCSKTGNDCAQHTGLEAQFFGFIFIGVAILSWSLLLKKSRYWPLYYFIPGLYGFSVLVYFIIRLIPWAR
jgi:hypothetical protein